jgi:hypothetical protein
MGPLILVAALLLAQADPGRPAPSTSAPPKAQPATPPKTNVDPRIELPKDKPPQPPEAPSDPRTVDKDSIKPKDGSVKTVPPAPSDPDKPAGVRPL